MNISHTLKALALGCFVAVSSTAVFAKDTVETRSFVYALDPANVTMSQLKNSCQPVLHFVAVDGMKYPVVYVNDPRIYTIKQYDLVTTDPENGHCDLIKKPYEYETMTIARLKIRFYNAGLQVDQRFEGSREALLGIALEEVSRAVGLLSSKKYSGTLLVDEYEAGMPMRWSFSSPDYVTAVRRYLEEAFKKTNVLPLENKPLLKLEVVNNEHAIDPIDLEFLNRYFTILDNNNAEVISFFNDAHDAIKTALDMTKDAKTVGQKGFEKLFTDIEKEASDFDLEKNALKAVKYAGGFVLALILIDQLKDEIKGLKKDFNAKCSQDGTWQNWFNKNKWYFAGGAAGAVAATLVYKAISRHIKKDARKRRRLAFEKEGKLEHAQHDAAVNAAVAVAA